MQKLVTGVVGFEDDFTPGDCEKCRFSYSNDDFTSVKCVFDCNDCPLFESNLPNHPGETMFYVYKDGDEARQYVESLI